MNKNRIGTLIFCLTAAMALFAMSAMPALAGEEANDRGHAYGHDRQDEKNFQEADEESSSADESSEDATTNESSSTDDSSTSDEGRSSSQSTSSSETTASPRSDQEDGPGKNWDDEGSPRGKSSGQCENTQGGTVTGGVYDSTCDGSSGKNGNGSGGAGGRPCAGCVGNADYKEPPGQLADGNHDGNAGYECDGNNGVARSNPAHTSCKRPAVTNLCPPGTDLAGLPPGPTGCDVPPNGLCPPGTDLAGLPPGPTGCDVPPNGLCPPGTDMAGLPPGPDGCDDDIEGRTDKVCPEGTDFAGKDMTDLKDCVLGTIFHNGSPNPPLGGVLPFTGAGDIYSWMAIGLLLTAMGMVSLKLRKKA